MLSPLSNDMAVSPSDLEFIEQVGTGTSVQVWKGKWNGKGGGITVAIKKIPVDNIDPRAREETLNEVSIHLYIVVVLLVYYYYYYYLSFHF